MSVSLQKYTGRPFMDNDCISIIVPVFNCAAYIEKCLSSLCAQSHKNIEIICVNDKSEDSSLKIINCFRQKDSRVKIIDHAENMGVSAARNDGMSAARGDFIMFVDGDDWVDQTICETLYSASLEYDADSAMCCYMKEFSGRAQQVDIFDGQKVVLSGGDVREKFLRRLFGPSPDELKDPAAVDALVSPCMQLFKRKALSGCRFKDIAKTGTFEDGLFQIDVYQNVERFVYINKPLYHYRKTNPASITTSYKPDLFEKWLGLFETMSDIIKTRDYGGDFEIALKNRIALGVVGLGLNEIADKSKSLLKKADRVKSIISSDIMKTALFGLELGRLALHWKIFFALCRYRLALPVTLMLEIIEILRRRG